MFTSFGLPLILPLIIAPNNSKCKQEEIIDSIRSAFDVDEWCIYMASGRMVAGSKSPNFLVEFYEIRSLWL